LASQKSAKDRIVSPEAVIAAAPDVILASWCGKKVVPNDPAGAKSRRCGPTASSRSSLL
jgi:ABC-type Fe3+-hydroxamate transport system substrate-binding protein